MADTLEYSEVGFPRDRFDDELIAEIEKFAPSQLEISDRDGDGNVEVIIKHVYIERRMIPLNIYLQEAFDAGGADPDDPSPAAARAREQIERGVIEYGNAIKDLVAANIFPGDMLWKNFGITRQAKWCFTTTTRSNTSPTAISARCPNRATKKTKCRARSGTPSGPRMCSRKPLARFCWATRWSASVHEAPRRPAGRGFWQSHKERIQAGYVYDVFPYDQDKRFQIERANAQERESI